MQTVVFAIFGCVVGALPIGWLVAERHGINLRLVGSRNIGATNVARSIGLAWGLLVLLLDAAKAAAWPAVVGAIGDQPSQAISALAVVFGNCFSPFLGFRGGKGVASGLGAILVLCPAAALSGLLVFAASYLLSRISSLGSLAGALITVLVTAVVGDAATTVAVTGIVVLIFLRHAENIRRLRAGRELRVSPDSRLPTDANAGDC